MSVEGYPDYVNGKDNLIYSLVKKIGEGGQGCVFATSDGKRAVKLSYRDKTAEDGGEKSKAASARIEKIAALPLWNLAISRPIIAIEPTGDFEGYVMDLLTGMMPIDSLMLPSKSLSGKEAIINWHVKETGGLIKRLKVLASAAETIATLHSLGLVFGDPSANNILVSADPDEFHTWLIDPDNIGLARKNVHAITNRGTPIARSVRTPGYHAPELLEEGREVCSLTDAYGFAVIVCKTLTQNHPYCGKLAVTADDEKKAFNAEFPWIGDKNDKCNVATKGMPFSLVMTKTLLELSDRTFSNFGKVDNRPGVREWADALNNAADVCIECKQCRATYFPTREGILRDQCPCCEGQRTNFTLMKIARFVPEWTEGAFDVTYPGCIVETQIDTGNACITDKPFLLTKRTAFGIRGFDNPDANQTVLTIRADSEKLYIDPIGKNPFLLVVNTNAPKELNVSCSVKWSDGPIVLHFGAMDKPHRVASFKYY